MSTAPPSSKSWNPPAYSSGGTSEKSRPEFAASEADTMRGFESYAIVEGRLPADEKYDTPAAATSSTACATMPSWKKGST